MVFRVNQQNTQILKVKHILLTLATYSIKNALILQDYQKIGGQ
jgi:hypothetical protein